MGHHPILATSNKIVEQTFGLLYHRAVHILHDEAFAKEATRRVLRYSKVIGYRRAPRGAIA
jgi:hypothetical protein